MGSSLPFEPHPEWVRFSLRLRQDGVQGIDGGLHGGGDPGKVAENLIALLWGEESLGLMRDAITEGLHGRDKVLDSRGGVLGGIEDVLGSGHDGVEFVIKGGEPVLEAFQSLRENRGLKHVFNM